MSTKLARHTFERGLLSIVVAALMIFSGLPDADAGTTILHNERAPYSWIPADIIEAEDWSRAADIGNQPTSDEGGGENVGWIHDGDWTEYTIGAGSSFDETTLYTVEARVASATHGGTINMSVDGIHVGSLKVDGTGGWQNWTTVRSTVAIRGGAEQLSLTFNGGDGPLLNINWLNFEYAVTGTPENSREEAVDQLVTALESYEASAGTFAVEYGGLDGNGQGWAFFQGGVRYPKSIAYILRAGGHLPAQPLHDELWTSKTSINGDVLVYSCRDRVGVFTRHGDGEPSAEDRAWWDANGCNRYPIDQLGAKYFALSGASSPESEIQRQDAVDAFVVALESYGAEHQTYRVADGGYNGSGQGWAFYEGDGYATSTANVLIDGGHLAAVPLHDPLWIADNQIVGDVLTYLCHDRVAVFAREGDLEPSPEDRDWWDNNGCSRYPVDQLGVSYFALSEPL